MTDRSPWLVALATANLVFLAAAAWFVRGRLAAVEDRLPPPRPAGAPADAAPTEAPTPRGDRDGAKPAGAGPAEDAPTTADLAKRIQKLSDDAYDNYSEVMNDLHELKRVTKQTSAAVRRIAQGLASPGRPDRLVEPASPRRGPDARDDRGLQEGRGGVGRHGDAGARRGPRRPQHVAVDDDADRVLPDALARVGARDAAARARARAARRHAQHRQAPGPRDRRLQGPRRRGLPAGRGRRVRGAHREGRQAAVDPPEGRRGLRRRPVRAPRRGARGPGHGLGDRPLLAQRAARGRVPLLGLAASGGLRDGRRAGVGRGQRGRRVRLHGPEQPDRDRARLGPRGPLPVQPRPDPEARDPRAGRQGRRRRRRARAGAQRGAAARAGARREADADRDGAGPARGRRGRKGRRDALHPRRATAGSRRTPRSRRGTGGFAWTSTASPSSRSGSSPSTST